jgi:hypothetical protein
MSKRRKKHHKTTRRHSKKHSMHGIDVMNVVGVAAGAVAAGLLNKVIPETVNTKIVAAGKIALGIALPNFVKSGSMKNTLSGVGSGMIAVGTIDLLKDMGVLSGTGDTLDISLNGDQDNLGADVLGGGDISVVSADVLGADDISVVSGMDEDY